MDLSLNARELEIQQRSRRLCDEHLLPLFVALGAAGESARAERVFAGVADKVLAMDTYAFWPLAA